MMSIKPQVSPIGKPDIHGHDLSERFNKILEETVEAMEKDSIHYMFIGGIASGGLGRPRSTHDIDLFVTPEEAELALQALAKRGFRTEKTDPSWLYKGFKDGILVDIIFKSKGEIYLDREMYQRMITAKFHGKSLRIVAPEDLLIIKAAAHSELTPNHWHDAIALLSYADIDWAYLIKRARRAPRRILSLLLYAQSNDIWVPNNVIQQLYSGVFENINLQVEQKKTAEFNRVKDRGRVPYAIAHLREKLAEDARLNELDIEIDQIGEKIVLRGEVQQAERKAMVQKLAKESFPDRDIDNQIEVSHFHEPPQAEEIK